MSDLVQHIIVGSIVVACVALVVRQFMGTFASASGGSCCKGGCAATKKPDDRSTNTAAHAQREQFILSQTLARRARK